MMVSHVKYCLEEKIKIIYVDEATFSFVGDAIKAGLDNPFRCEVCKEEYDDLVYEG